MKARLLAAALLLGSCAGCAGPHAHSAPAAEEIDYEVQAKELHDQLAYDLEHSPYYQSPLRWSNVYWRMIELGVLPEETSRLIRRAARSTVSAQDVDGLLDKATDADGFLVALDAANAGAVAEARPPRAGRAYDLPSAEALELWLPFARLVDSAPRCGNSLHWLPVYKDLMRLGYSEHEAISVCRRALLTGMGRFEVEEVLDASKRDKDTFTRQFEPALAKAEARVDSRAPSFGVRAFFSGETFSAKSAPQTLDVGPKAPGAGAAPAPSAPPADAPPVDGPPADAPFSDPPVDAPLEDEPPADVPLDDAPPADVPLDDAPPAEPEAPPAGE